MLSMKQAASRPRPPWPNAASGSAARSRFRSTPRSPSAARSMIPDEPGKFCVCRFASQCRVKLGTIRPPTTDMSTMTAASPSRHPKPWPRTHPCLNPAPVWRVRYFLFRQRRRPLLWRQQVVSRDHHQFASPPQSGTCEQTYPYPCFLCRAIGGLPLSKREACWEQST